ncbi:hypothetical protein IJH89_01300 [Candidatus Saccharibacteria bacterium]|nr:hypothetical protein [Candidatus Saccharibacteria bacterium]
MAVIRVPKVKNYTIMANFHLNDERLSLKAKGLLSFMLSKPDGWDYSLNGLISQVKEGKTAVLSALKELKKYGYLKVTRKNGVNGRYQYIYDVFEKPESGIPSSAPEMPSTQNQSMGTELQVNTDIVRTDKVRTERTNVGTAKAAPTRAFLEEKREQIRAEKTEAYKLALKLRDLILKNKPTRKIPKDWEIDWTIEIDRIHRLDSKSWEEIDRIIVWSQRDRFWRKNILSGGKLRQQFERLEDQREYEAEKRPTVVNLNEV